MPPTMQKRGRRTRCGQGTLARLCDNQSCVSVMLARSTGFSELEATWLIILNGSSFVWGSGAMSVAPQVQLLAGASIPDVAASSASATNGTMTENLTMAENLTKLENISKVVLGSMEVNGTNLSSLTDAVLAKLTNTEQDRAEDAKRVSFTGLACRTAKTRGSQSGVL